MIFQKQFYAVGIWLLAAGMALAAETNKVAATDLFSKPMSLADAMSIALEQNNSIREGKADLEANYGVVMQFKAVLLPQISTANKFNAGQTESDYDFKIKTIPDVVSFRSRGFTEQWQGIVQIQQSIYEGGRMTSALRASRLSRDQALLQYQAVVADALLSVVVSYDDVLLAEQNVSVQESSITLLTSELADATNRFSAGAVPRFNVLQAEVELANAKPTLIRARNAYRIAKDNFISTLGLRLPPTYWENIPVRFSDKLEAIPYEVELPEAIGRALATRPELAALQKNAKLRQEAVTAARAVYKPSVQLIGGYQWQNNSFYGNFIEREQQQDSAWFGGGQLSWTFYDGNLTRGKVKEAEGRLARSKVEIDEAGSRIELEVRTAYSQFIQAREVLESQKKVQEEAAEALRLAEARLGAGSGIQLDVLNAQNALTAARTTQIQALHDHNVARVRLQRAIGDFPETIIAK